MTASKLIKLNDGTSIPPLAYGTGTAWYKSPDSELSRDLIESIKTAIKLGYTHLDGAEAYNTERELGIAIAESGLPRNQLYVVTKVNQGVTDILGAIRSSLDKLKLKHVDLYLIHQPFFANGSDAALQAAWAEMEKVREAGLAVSIGVSNYLPQHLNTTLRTAKVAPAVNQIEYHPYLQHKELLQKHRKHGIVTAAYGPLTAVTKAKPGPVDAVYERLAKKYGVNAGQIALRWCLQQDIVAVTTSGKEDRMKEYLKAGTFELTTEEVEEIRREGEKKHFRGFWTTKYAKDDGS
ncbi:MAG: hypothetical protein M1825_004467 [Sarcosagium campestre]|nr:MAG: hypothetical protein M1825_004467 [Sarcosagium campestre]